jgi:hypothetical protein
VRSHRCPEQFTVEPRTRFQKVEKRQLRPQSKLERRITELKVEIEKADIAAEMPFVLGCADRELRQERSCANPADALDDANELAIRRLSGRGRASHLVADWQKRRFEIRDVER